MQCCECLHPEVLRTHACTLWGSDALPGRPHVPCTDAPARHATETGSAPRAVIANELKYKAPHAHTMLELVYVRWGRAAHIVYFFFAVLTNLLVSLSMLQGGHHLYIPQ